MGPSVCVCVCMQVLVLVLACVCVSVTDTRRPDFLPPNRVLPASLDICPRIFRPETREVSGASLVLSSLRDTSGKLF